MRVTPLIVLGLVGLCSLPAPVDAQASHDALVSVGVFAGGSLPTGRMSRLVYDPGSHIGGLAELRLPTRWVRLRVDGAYHRLGMGSQVIMDATGRPTGEIMADTRLASTIASAVVRPPVHSPVQPYALLGIGVSRLRTHWRGEGADVASGSSDPRWESNASAGLGIDARVGRAVLFAEARYQRVSPAVRLMPLSIGVRAR
jgi:hypothetical protein